MIGMVMSFGSLAASIWIMVDPYIKHGALPLVPLAAAAWWSALCSTSTVSTARCHSPLYRGPALCHAGEVFPGVAVFMQNFLIFLR